MMMPSAILGTLLPLTVGWLLVRCLEKDQIILNLPERLAVSWLSGTTLSMFVVFLCTVTFGLPLNWWGYGVVYLGLIGFLFLYKKCHPEGFRTAPSRRSEQTLIPQDDSAESSRRMKILSWILLLWITLKLTGAAFSLLATPIYFDDAFGNWNLRARVYTETQTLSPDLPLGNGNIDSVALTSYPPMVPLLKSSYTAFYGQWHEGLASLPHLLWYLCVLLLLYGLISRRSTTWAVVSLYVFTALPLPLVHAFASYADILVAAHLLAIVGLLVLSLEHQSVLKISSVLLALLIFTKNEAVLLYLPILFLLHLFVLYRSKHSLKAYGCLLIAVSCIALPWLSYKWFHGLPFGNAKSIGGLGIEWQSGVARAIFINTFFLGNWNIIPLLFIGILIWKYQKLCQLKYLIPLIVLLVTLGQQIGIFLFTGLSVEALNQTGVARGILQIMPIVVMLSMQLLIREERC